MEDSTSLRDNRHINKLFYVLHRGSFYEPFDSHYKPSSELLSTVQFTLKNGEKRWNIRRARVWYEVEPPMVAGNDLPSQGWKIHLSATPENCQRILAKVATVAQSHDMRFKFALDINTLKMMNSKQWSRGGSGKFITVYPCNDETFRSIIELIYSSIRKELGPYILSDKRYKDCRCLYYRYGAIAPIRRLGFMGNHIQVLNSPDGKEVVDKRVPYFNPPSWVEDPFATVLADQDPPAMTLNKCRFRVKEAFGLSNTGGVYLAIDAVTGRKVIIKEARPFTEVQEGSRDATDRLKHEGELLELISDLHVAPSVITTFQDWENFYLVEEYIDASNLRDFFMHETPMSRINPTTADSRSFYDIFKTVFTSLLEAIEKIHDRGIAIGDISPKNVLIDKDSYVVKFIDFEGASRVGVDEPVGVVTLGFNKPPTTREGDKPGGFTGDLYAIGALMMYSLFPITTMIYLRNDLYTDVLRVMLADAGLVQTQLHTIITGLHNNTLSCLRARELLEKPVVIEAPRAAMENQRYSPPMTCCEKFAQYLLQNYRLDKKFSLFPADPVIFHTNSIGLGFGTAGIIYSLAKCGFEIPSQVSFMFKEEIDGVGINELAPGLLTGAAGLSLALFGIGNCAEAERFISYANCSELRFDHHSLYYGSAGIGMANLAAYKQTDDKTYLDSALACADFLAKTAREDAKGIHWEVGGVTPVGFGYGQSGVALFLLRLSQILQADDWKELGRNALNYDLSFAHEREPGVLTFPRDSNVRHTYEPYIEEGSAGVAKVAIRYGLWDVVDRILVDTHRKYSVFAGLLYGMSGFVDVLVDAYLYSKNSRYLEMAERPFQGILDLYLIKNKDGYATPGENLIRISCDYATGIAGVMRTMYRLGHLSHGDFSLDELDFPLPLD